MRSRNDAYPHRGFRNCAFRDPDGFNDEGGRTAVPHRCRNTFKDYGEDDTASELALSHAVRSKTKRSYRRTDLLDPRRFVMQRWADYVTGETSDKQESAPDGAKPELERVA